MVVEPSESAFDDPAAWRDDKAFLVVMAEDDLKATPIEGGYQLGELPATAAVDPNAAQKQLSSLSILAGCHREDVSTSKPRVSTRRCRLRPLTCLPLS